LEAVMAVFAGINSAEQNVVGELNGVALCKRFRRRRSST
jgi:hypothetical protein